jgi:hypothetical protein
VDSWEVASVVWSSELGQVGVCLYDVAMAADLELDENEMNLACETGIGLITLEFSSICDVHTSIKASKSARG